MNEEDKRCWCCAYFSLYYTCGWDNFYPKDVGLCKKSGKTVSQQDCCQKWRFAKPFTEFRVEKALHAIPLIRRKLEAIEQILSREIELEETE